MSVVRANHLLFVTHRNSLFKTNEFFTVINRGRIPIAISSDSIFQKRPHRWRLSVRVTLRGLTVEVPNCQVTERFGLSIP